MLRFETDDLTGDPVLLLVPGQLVEVDQRFPPRLALPIALNARTTPDATDVGFVLPEVVDRAAVNLAEGKPRR